MARTDRTALLAVRELLALGIVRACADVVLRERVMRIEVAAVTARAGVAGVRILVRAVVDVLGATEGESRAGLGGIAVRIIGDEDVVARPADGASGSNLMLRTGGGSAVADGHPLAIGVIRTGADGSSGNELIRGGVAARTTRALDDGGHGARGAEGAVVSRAKSIAVIIRTARGGGSDLCQER